MTQKIQLTMPQPGETITQGTIIKWLVPLGKEVKEKEAVAELETEKAVFEYESPFEGKIVEFLVNPPATVPVGQAIAVFEVSDEKAKSYNMLGLWKSETATVPEKKATSTLAIQPSSASSKPADIPLSPLVRKMIRENQISDSELSSISASGDHGRITKEDIQKFLENKNLDRSQSSSQCRDDSAQFRPQPPLSSRDEVIPCSPIRLRIAENMVLSKQTIPHAHTGVTIDMTRLMDYRNRTKDAFKQVHGFSPGMAALMFPALRKAITAFPIVNSSFRDEGASKSIVLHKYLNMGMAVDTDRGLYVVTVHNAHEMSFLQFARALNEAVKRAKDNKLKPEDLTGMTFTLNNYGFYGTRFGVQVILPPQSTTLGVGKVEKRPWIVDDGIHMRWLSDFTMAFDHRVMDGRDAGLFLESLKKALEDFNESDLG